MHLINLVRLPAGQRARFLLRDPAAFAENAA
jgi:hypothetical protein